MDLDDQIKLEHLIFTQRKCRVCGEYKDLVNDFYLTRKSKGSLPSAYSYECKSCTIQRIKHNRRKKVHNIQNYYPDW